MKRTITSKKKKEEDPERRHFFDQLTFVRLAKRYMSIIMFCSRVQFTIRYIRVGSERCMRKYFSAQVTKLYALRPKKGEG